MLARTTAMVWSFISPYCPVCDVTAARLKAEEAGAAQHGRSREPRHDRNSTGRITGITGIPAS